MFSLGIRTVSLVFVILVPNVAQTKFLRMFVSRLLKIFFELINSDACVMRAQIGIAVFMKKYKDGGEIWE